MKKVIVLFGIMLMAVACNHQTTSQQPTTNTVPYTNSEYVFTLDLPQGWIAQNDAQSGIVDFESPQSQNCTANENDCPSQVTNTNTPPNLFMSAQSEASSSESSVPGSKTLGSYTYTTYTKNLGGAGLISEYHYELNTSGQVYDFWTEGNQTEVAEDILKTLVITKTAQQPATSSQSQNQQTITTLNYQTATDTTGWDTDVEKAGMFSMLYPTDWLVDDSGFSQPDTYGISQNNSHASVNISFNSVDGNGLFNEQLSFVQSQNPKLLEPLQIKGAQKAYYIEKNNTNANGTQNCIPGGGMLVLTSDNRFYTLDFEETIPPSSCDITSAQQYQTIFNTMARSMNVSK